MNIKLLKIYKVWLVIGLIIWHIFFFSQGNALPLYTDLLIVFTYFARKLWRTWDLSTTVKRYPTLLVYGTLAYGMVIIEETIAALINNINEGFNVGLFIIRTGQFNAFNLLGFSGIIIGLYLLNRLRILNKRESVVLIALFGIYAEHVYTQSPIIFLVYAPIVMYIYYLIFMPAVSILKEESTRSIHKVVRYVLSGILVFVLSMPFVGIIMVLREHHPEYFPPCKMINCT
jgi:hypothetical protein